jgi:hypothetical protein
VAAEHVVADEAAAVTLEAAFDRRVEVPLSTYQLVPSDQGGLVIGYGRVRGEALEVAVGLLAAALRRVGAAA